MLNDIEQEFIEFVSKKRNYPLNKIKAIYLETKNKFKFSSDEYKNICSEVHELNKILYDDTDEKDIIDSYRFHELMHTFRQISYSYPKKTQHGLKNQLQKILNEIIYIMRELILKPFLRKFRKKKTSKYNIKEISEFIMNNIKKPPIIVDYGCGLAYISFNIAKINKNTKVYLLDIDCLHLDFIEYYFKKNKIDIDVIRITKDNLYPKLPNHNICIANQVFEHLLDPVRAFNNIFESLEKGGLLIGEFSNKSSELFHVSPNLSIIRERIGKNFKRIGEIFYLKIS